jgi:glutamyl-tRNA synthetase
MDKLNFVNQEHLKRMDPVRRREIVEPFWKEMGLHPEAHAPAYLESALTLMGGRGKTTRELASYSDYFVDFAPVTERYDASEITLERLVTLQKFFGELLDLTEWRTETMERCARDWCEKNAVQLKEIAMPLRWALTGQKVSPGIFDVAELLGRDECARRLSRYRFIAQRYISVD